MAEQDKTEAVGLLKKLAQALGLVAEIEKVEQEKPPVAEKIEQVSKAEFDKMAEKLAALEAENTAAKAEATAQAETVAKMAMEKRDAEFAVRAEGYAPLPLKAAEFAPILRKCADVLTEDENKELDRVLSAAAAMAKAGNITTEIGSGAQDEGTAAAKVASKLDELKKAHPAKSDAQLRTMIWKADPGLRRAYEDEQRGQPAR